MANFYWNLLCKKYRYELYFQYINRNPEELLNSTCISWK